MGRGDMDWTNNPLGRSRHRWEDNIKMNLKVGRVGMDWMHLAQDRGRIRGALVNTIINIRIP